MEKYIYCACARELCYDNVWVCGSQVLNTMAFKEALSLQHLPRVVIHSIPTSPPSFSRSWQFSTLYPMLGGRFVVTVQENTLFILDSISRVIVGVAALNNSIKSVSTSGGFVYVLTKETVIVRVAVHHSYVTTENESKKLSTLSAPTSVNNSPMGSVESLKDSEECVISVEAESNLCAKQHENLDDKKSLPIQLQVEDKECSAIPASDVTQLSVDVIPTVCVSEWDASHDELLEHDQASQVSVSSLKSEAQSERLDREDLKASLAEDSEPEISRHFDEIGSDEDASACSTTTVQNSEMTLLPILQGGPLTQVITDKEHELSEKLGSTVTQLDDVNEHSRRLRMSLAARDDIVADSKSHRKRKKRYKGKKLSSAASKYHISKVA